MAGHTRPQAPPARRRAVALLATVLAAALAAAPAAAQTAATAPVAVAAVTPVGTGAPDARGVCAAAGPGSARCTALVQDAAPGSAATAAAEAAADASPRGYWPDDLRDAYGLAAASAQGGHGATIAIVDAYDAPTAEADLAVYRAQFGMAPCTTANGCFAKINQNGGTAVPAYDPGWAMEIALDLDMASAICPNCRLLLVEASSGSVADLGAAVNRAVARGAAYVSNSYTAPESRDEVAWDAAYYTHPGVVITASTGDDGYGVSFPAASPHVVAVGGTSLWRSGGTWGQAAWQGAGSGCSAYEPKPAWQHDTGCARRTVADVAAVADPATGVAVYCTRGDSCRGWLVAGGTSAAAPIVAAAYALAGAAGASGSPASYPYLRGGLTDVVGGSNGTCGSYLCRAVVGYDGPTGLGTPSGVTPLTAAAAPAQPLGVAAVAGAGSARVSWSPPASDGGSPITGYSVTASPGGAGCSWAAGPLECAVSGLANGQGYTFTVSASNAYGTGAASGPSATVVPSTSPGAPAAVAAAPGRGAISVSWSPPASDGGSPVTAYRVTASPGGAGCSWAAGPLECAVSGLANGQGYTFTVSASNASGDGPASEPSAEVAPADDLPDPPADVAAVPAAPILGALTVTWAAPGDGGEILAYTAAAFDARSFAPTGRACAWSGGALGCTITGLTPGVAVVVRVTASSGAGTGLPSAPSAPVAPPLPPAASIAALPSWSVGDTIKVAWAAAPGGSPVAGYDVRYRRAVWTGGLGAYTGWLALAPGASATFAPVAGSSYCFSVRAHDAAGFAGAWSAERCTSVPLDERSLSRRGAWQSGTGSAYYRHTWSRTQARGATAVRTLVAARQIVLVATTCPSCGTVQVYLDRTLLRTISLRSPTTMTRRVITVAAFPTIRRGTVTVKVSTAGRTVLLDGLGLSGL